MDQINNVLNNGFIIAIVVGILVGAIAGKIMKQTFSFLGCLIVGIVGGIIGSYLIDKLGITIKGSNPITQLALAIGVDVLGAVVLLKIVDIAKK